MNQTVVVGSPQRQEGNGQTRAPPQCAVGVSRCTPAALVDDSPPHVVTKSDIMLIQSEKRGGISKHGRSRMRA
ncbi:hypothetical protein EYF80_068215 [Liparis tanakae]|uniref:Uncharacterized protein n=1 Tax=Liparis tanakae TaxID=230148 RepID=A0A4Z2DYP2_9TELE|nr:hypothetical protein EYF80_068215 [Liparis tanakae]